MQAQTHHDAQRKYRLIMVMDVHVPMLNAFRKLLQYNLKNKAYQNKNANQVVVAMVSIWNEMQYCDAKQVGPTKR